MAAWRVLFAACSTYWRNLTHVFATQRLRVLRKTSPLIMALPRQLVMVARSLFLERRRRKAMKGKNICIAGTRTRTYMLQRYSLTPLLRGICSFVLFCFFLFLLFLRVWGC
jgi:hypothetical protein